MPEPETHCEPHWRRTLTILWFANFITALGMFAMIPFLTYYVEELGVHDPVARNRWSGLIVGAAPIVAALLGPFWGSMGDRFGLKLMVLRAKGAIIIFVGLIGFAESVWTVFALRILQGAFSGYIPSSMALASVQAPKSAQGRVTALMSATMPAGSVAGYVMGGYIAERGSLQIIFPICSALATISFLAVLTFVKDAKRPAQEIEPMRRFERLARDCKTVLAMPSLRSLLLAVVTVRALVSTIDPIFARFVVELGSNKQEAGQIFCMQALAGLVFLPVMGYFSDRIGHLKVFLTCCAGLSITMWVQMSVTEAYWLYALRALVGLFLAGILPAAYTLAAKESQAAGRGSAIGVVFMGVALAHGVGAAIGGELLNLFGFSGLFGCTALGVALVGLLLARRRSPDMRESRA